MVLEGNMQAAYTFIFHCCYSPQTEGLSNTQEIISTSSLALKQPHLALFLSSFRGCRINMAASPLSGPWTHPRSLASKETLLAEFQVYCLDTCLYSFSLSILSGLSGGSRSGIVT